jgi:DNA-binding NarL/FixJ family response regulator
MAKALQLLLAEEFEVIGVAMTALALVEVAIQTAPDVIVSDITMPDGSGLTAAAAILARRPDTRIVLVTVQDHQEVIRAAFDLGVRGYVLKSDAGDELVPAVRSVLAGARFLSSKARLSLGEPTDWDRGEQIQP